MSDEARAWAKCVAGLRIPTKAVLNALAGYADAAGEAFPSVKTLAVVTCMSERYVRRQLAQLEASGHLVRIHRVGEDGRKDGGQTSNLYRLAIPDEQLVGRDAPPEHMDKGPRHKRSGAPCASVPPIRTSVEGVCSDEHPSGDEDFEAVFAAWLNKAPSTSRVKALAEWRQWVDGVGPARLRAAAVRYLTEDPDVRRYGPKWLDKWLAEERWRGWLRPLDAAAPPLPECSFDGPPWIREGMLTEGEAFVSAYLDPSAWDSARQAITPKTLVAYERLRDRFGRDLAANGVRLLDPRAGASEAA